MNSTPLILLGAGGVGRALIQQIVRQRGLHAAQFGLRLAVLALCDRDGAVIADRGELDDATLLSLLHFKQAGGRFARHELGGPHNDLSAVIDVAGRKGAIVVDCTATDETTPALLFARERHYPIVLANKKPLTQHQEVYYRLTRAGGTGAAGEPRQSTTSRWETTCGAALPIIGTLNRLVAAGDTVHRIAGTFSGTLGFVMSGLQDGRLFSEVVREAHQLGYTEPDPRDDLGGVDVARKALILARGLGAELEMSDVQVTGLYPPSMAQLSVGQFLAALPELDDEMGARVSAAAVQGQVLRFAATVMGIGEGFTLTVGPTLVDANSPLGRLSGTDNLVEFYTRWYDPNPLVVQGRGAGVDVTASGVLADVVELAGIQR
jgi:homoserine dehydrogenase